jgi:superfamily I DNA/RNA helicase
VWDLTERFNQRLAADGAWCWPQLRASVAIAERYGAKGPRRYRHVVVDEAQDLTPAHWLLLRALVPEDADDLFIAGDTYQRIYGQPVTLGKLGIDIRGRSRKLTLNYRTTREILRAALAIEADATADDLDGDLDSLAGYRSVMTGANPRFQPHPTEDAELAAIADQVKVWTAEHLPGSVAVTVPSNAMAERVIAALEAEDLPAQPLTAEQNPGEDVVHVGTMHRLKDSNTGS